MPALALRRVCPVAWSGGTRLTAAKQRLRLSQNASINFPACRSARGGGLMSRSDRCLDLLLRPGDNISKPYLPGLPCGIGVWTSLGSSVSASVLQRAGAGSAARLPLRGPQHGRPRQWAGDHLVLNFFVGERVPVPCVRGPAGMGWCGVVWVTWA